MDAGCFLGMMMADFDEWLDRKAKGLPTLDYLPFDWEVGDEEPGHVNCRCVLVEEEA